MELSPALTAKLDKLAKEGGCTLTGVGYCDLYWGTMVTNLAGSSHKITKIVGSSSYNVEDYGIALAEGHGAGLTVEEFNKTIGCYNDTPSAEMKELVESGKYVPSYMWNQNGWLCSKMGLHIISQTQKCIPCIDKEDLRSETLGMVVKAGNATGMRAVVTTTTEEGITLETECIGKIYNPEEIDRNVWTLYGEPETTCIVNQPATVEADLRHARQPHPAAHRRARRVCHHRPVPVQRVHGAPDEHLRQDEVNKRTAIYASSALPRAIAGGLFRALAGA